MLSVLVALLAVGVLRLGNVDLESGLDDAMEANNRLVGVMRTKHTISTMKSSERFSCDESGEKKEGAFHCNGCGVHFQRV